MGLHGLNVPSIEPGLCALTALLLLSGCGSKGQVMDGDGMLNSYKQISQDEAKEMMLRPDGHVILDVRRQDEFDAGHIPGAILIPNESIDTTPPKELPDFNQIILIYCRSGNRSKQAAQKRCFDHDEAGRHLAVSRQSGQCRFL